jgi:hypothetical protein
MIDSPPIIKEILMINSMMLSKGRRQRTAQSPMQPIGTASPGIERLMADAVR